MPGVQKPHWKPRCFDEGLLERVQPVAAGQALDGDDLLAVDVPHGRRAGAHGLVVDEHRAGAAQGLAAAELGAGEAEVVAQHPQQHPVFVDRHARGLPLSVNDTTRMERALRAGRAASAAPRRSDTPPGCGCQSAYTIGTRDSGLVARVRLCACGMPRVASDRATGASASLEAGPQRAACRRLVHLSSRRCLRLDLVPRRRRKPQESAARRSRSACARRTRRRPARGPRRG